MYINKLFAITLLLLFTEIESNYAFSFEGAKWISVSADNQKQNQWLCFRKQLFLESLEEKATMYIAADSKYWLWINEKLVVFEGGLKRGPNPYDTYYDSLEVSKYLKKGDNTIAVLLWYWGKDGYCHKSSGKSGLLVQMHQGKNHLSTDRSWKVCIHPSFGETTAPNPNYRLPESNVHFDARKELGKWYAGQFDDSLWDQATVLGEYPCEPWNRLHARPFPLWKDSGLMSYEKTIKKLESNQLIVTGQLPRNITVTPYLKIKSKAGLTIDIRSDNYKGGSEYNTRAEYVTKEGVQTFEMPNYINGHNIIYTFPFGVKILEVGYRETRFDTEHIGQFICNDEFYNQLWNKALNTMNLNMRDAIQDPDRERSQWWGDAAIILHEIFYSCDTNGYSAVKKAVCNLVDWQKADGTLFSPVPSGTWNGELPLQMLASVGKYGFWSYYWYTNDLDCVKYMYPSIKKYLALWNIDENGLVKHRQGGWDWADWGENIDMAVLDNAWYCLALQSTIEMGKMLNDIEFVNYYTSQLRLISSASSNHFWNGEVFRSPTYKGITDDRANGLALLAGFASADQKEKIRNFLKKREAASPYMEKYVLEALFANGFIEDGLLRMKNRYRHMVESPLTTLWEDWIVGGAGGGSINHGWSGGPLSLLSQYVAGVSAYKPGWESIMIKPQLGSLKWVNCIVPVFNKELKLSIKSDVDKWELKVENDTNKECILALPRFRIKNFIEINGYKVIYSNGFFDVNKFVQLVNMKDESFIYVKMIGKKIKIVL